MEKTPLPFYFHKKLGGQVRLRPYTPVHPQGCPTPLSHLDWCANCLLLYLAVCQPAHPVLFLYVHDLKRKKGTEQKRKSSRETNGGLECCHCISNCLREHYREGSPGQPLNFKVHIQYSVYCTYLSLMYGSSQ